MAEVNHFSASAVTLSADTLTTADVFEEPSNTCKISGASLAANTKYLIVAKGRHGTNHADGKGSLRVQTDDDSTIAAASTSTWEPALGASSQLATYFFVRSFTTDASPADVKFEVAIANTSNTSYADQLSLFLLDLDDLGSGNYIEDTDDTAGDLAVAGTELASLTTLDDSTEYLFLGCGVIEVDSTGSSMATELRDGPTTVMSTVYLEGEDTGELRVFGAMNAWTTAATALTASVWCRADSTTAADSIYSYLIALKTSAFKDFEYSYSETGESVSAATETNVEEITAYTPTTSGDHLVLGGVTVTDSAKLGATVEVGGVEVLAGDATPKTYAYDSTDRPHADVMGVVSISAESDIDLLVTCDAAQTTEYEFVAVLNLNLDAVASLDLIQPISDVSGAGWESAPTGGQDLYAQVDEVVTSDTDYIYAEDPNP